MQPDTNTRREITLLLTPFNQKGMSERKILEDGSRVCIVGGGPAGAFFAVHLLRRARRAGRDIHVTIIEKKAQRHPAGRPWLRRGCNHCAGGISPRLHALMADNGLALPDALVQEEFTHIWIHGLWKNFPLRVPAGQRMTAVFRGSLPGGRPAGTVGFDHFLLEKALAEGADIFTGEATEIGYTPEGKPLLVMKTARQETMEIVSDFVAVAAGINPRPGQPVRESAFFRSCLSVMPRFRPPAVRRTLLVELAPGRDYLRKYMDRELYFIESGSRRLPLEHIALVPKGDYLTVALVGKSIDRADLPRETLAIVKNFLSLPHIRTILPRLPLANPPVACACSPFMAVRPARSPVADRIAMVGDAVGARLYKDGLYSAFITAEALAGTVIGEGVDQASLRRGYRPVLSWLAIDNRYGRLVFGLIRTAFASPFLSRILYQSFATEMKFREKERWHLGGVLWKIGSGTGDYRDVFRELMSLPVVRSVAVGAGKTVRNLLTEAIFGIRWEDYGRYPTVIMKEKREYFRGAIARSLDVTLDAAPEMERMYAIKIRASARAIFAELKKFGDPRRRFLKLRFVSVRRISGSPGEVGTVIRYRLRHLPIAMDVRLVRSIPDKALLFEVQEVFADRGRLLFDITPTKDGNHRLVIYTAFDFKRGRGPAAGLFWRIFKALFPAYAHDVVWNHAICCIKGEAEKNDAQADPGRSRPTGI